MSEDVTSDVPLPRSSPGESSSERSASENAGASGSKGGSSKGERALILAAMEQASPGASSGSEDMTMMTQTATSPPRRAVDISPELFPGYDILGEIHRGGQGVVYQAMQRGTRRRVAIKVMHEGASGGSAGRARFDREVQVLGQLSHPGIVKIHDSGVTTDKSFYYVMDYISGKPFDEFIKGKKTEQSTATGQKKDLALFAKICDAVNAAHLKGVIHRDIKPANIRLDENGSPIVVDFGLAKVLAPDVVDESANQVMTTTGHFVGSLPWASPEQADGSPSAIDVRTDVYSLGVVLYQLVTGGKFPYTVSGNMREVLSNIQLAEPAKPSTVVGRKRINDELETIVLKALQKDRDRRYQNAGELGRDITRYLAGEPIEAKRDSGWYVVTKTVRRHRTAAGVAAGFMLFGIVFAVTMTFLYQEAEAARVIASESETQAREALGTAEQERARAEANFDAVRDLARTFMFDFHDEIANLRGATRAREMLLVEATDYLKKLSVQVADDPSLIAELAEAHERVGDILGGSLVANTGDSMTADGHYAEARRLREALVQARPEDPDRVSALADSMERTADALRRNGEFESAEAEYRLAVETYDRALALVEQVGEGRRPVIEIQDARADALLGVGQTRTRRMISTSDEEPDVANERATLAMDAYDEAELATIDADRAADDPETQRRLAAIEGQRASLFASLSQRTASKAARSPDQADELLARAIELATAGIEHAKVSRDRSVQVERSSPEVYRSGKDLVLAHGRLANTLYRRGLAERARGDNATAEQTFSESLESAEASLEVAASLAMDRSNLDAQRLLGYGMNLVGNALRELGQIEQAAELYETMVEHREEVHRTDPTPRHAADLGVAYVKRGEMDEKLGDLARDGGDARIARVYYQSATRSYRQGLAALTEAEGSTSRRLAIVEAQLDGVGAKLETLTDGSD